MPLKLRYDEGCLAAHALNLIGDRWALLVVRELIFGPKRFQALRAGVPGITAAVLTQRLVQLAQAGVVERDPGLGSYSLTESGSGLLHVLQAMCRWGAMQPGHDPRRFISPSGLMISMTALIDSRQARGQRVAAGFAMGTESFVMRLTGDSRPHVVATSLIEADFVLGGTANSLARAVYGLAPLADLADQDAIALTGDPDAAQAFVNLFTLGSTGADHNASQSY